MSTKYSVTLMRHRDDEDPEELVDLWIEPDDAVELAVKLKEMERLMAIPDENPEEEEESEEEEEPAEQGSRVEYDREALKREIREGEKKPAKLAAEYGVTVGVVYQLKSDMKKAGELDGPRTVKVDPAKIKDATVGVEIKVEPKQPGHSEEDHQKKMQALFRRLPEPEKELVRNYKEGCDRSELLQMYPSIATMRVDDLINAYGNIEI